MVLRPFHTEPPRMDGKVASGSRRRAVVAGGKWRNGLRSRLKSDRAKALVGSNPTFPRSPRTLIARWIEKCSDFGATILVKLSGRDRAQASRRVAAVRAARARQAKRLGHTPRHRRPRSVPRAPDSRASRLGETPALTLMAAEKPSLPRYLAFSVASQPVEDDQPESHDSVERGRHFSSQ